MNKNILKYEVNCLVKSLIGVVYTKTVRDSWLLDKVSYKNVQLKLFKNMYNYAISNVPYYKNNPLYHQSCNDKDDLMEILQKCPVFGKSALRENNIDFVSPKLKKWCTTHTTSGTTGTPVTIYSTPLERAFSSKIINTWYKKITKMSSSLPIIALSGFMTPGKNDELYWSAFGGRHLFLNIYAIKQANADKISSLINRYPEALFFGYASALAELGRVIDGRLINKNRFVSVATSEVLTPSQRTTIEKNLCSKVYDQYGSQEGSHLVLECDTGNMHLHPYLGFLEILNENDQPCKNGELGRVVVTGFRHSMPLIRYDIGDSAIAIEEKCNCGLSWPVIGSIIGRSEDLIITPDGRKIGYLNFHATKNLEGIAESQLIQNGYYDFKFLVVLKIGFETNIEFISKNENLIKFQLENRLGYKINTKFKYLHSIPRVGSQNKFKAVVVNFRP